MARLLVLLVLLALSLCISSSTGVSAPPPPSVLIILADDLGSADVGFNNPDSKIPTPNIDALARLHLSRYYTHNVCTPTRVSLLTGRTAWSVGNPFTMRLGGSLSRKFNTLAHELRARGFATHFVGKWGLDFPLPHPNATEPPTSLNWNGLGPRPQDGLTPLNRGFDTFYGVYDYGHDYFTKEMTFKGAIDWHRHNSTHQLDYPDVDPEPTVYSTHLFVREAKAVLSTWTPEKPSFMQLSFTAPHDPLQVPPEYIAPGTPCSRHTNWRRRTYCGMVAAVDEGVGQLVKTLEARNMLENTIIVFTSDNGGAPSVGGFNYPFRGQKTTPFEGGIRAPALIHAPTALGLKEGTYDNIIHVSDLAPTLIGLVDHSQGRESRHDILGDINGVDHSKALLLRSSEGDTAAASPPPRTSLLAEFNLVLNQTAFIKGDWKLILGTPGRHERFVEPTGWWYAESGGIAFKLEELVCNVIDLGLGPRWFALTWAYRFMLAFFEDYLGGERVGFSDWAKYLYLRSTPYNSTIEVNQQTLPVPHWHMYHRGYVRLYNLREDPYENANVALENKELVEALTREVHEIILRDSRIPGHHMSVQKQMVHFMEYLIFNFQLILAGTVAFVFLVLYLLRSKPKKTQKQKEH